MLKLFPYFTAKFFSEDRLDACVHACKHTDMFAIKSLNCLETLKTKIKEISREQREKLLNHFNMYMVKKLILLENIKMK